MCHKSCVMGQVSFVMCDFKNKVLIFKKNIFEKKEKKDQVMELVCGGSVINGAMRECTH